MTTAETTYSGYLGATTDGTRVWVTIKLRQVDRTTRTTDHREIDGYEELSITGTTERGGGQIIDTARKVVDPAPGITIFDVRHLAEVWDEWHLNGMRAGCDHQADAQGTAADKLDHTPPCPDTGYRWGSAWLAQELPADVKQWIREFGEKLNSDPAESRTDRFAREHGIRLWRLRRVKNRKGWESGRSWTVTLRMDNGRLMSVPFNQGAAHTENPTVSDVLECLASDASGYDNADGFADWCAELGFDPDDEITGSTDSKARRMYTNTELQTRKLQEFLGDGELYDELLYDS